MLLAFLWLNGLAGQPAPPSEPAGEIAVLETETQRLEQRLKLAESDVFYLVLDGSASEITLMFGGAVLQRYAVTGIEIGRPRRFFTRVDRPAGWDSLIWENGALAPARPVHEVEVTPPQPAAEAPPPPVIPPTAEEAIPVPMRYRIRFDGGLALEIVPVVEPATSGWWSDVRATWSSRWRDVRSAFRSADRDVVRVRVTLERDAAAALYRSLPPQPKLLIASLR